MKFAYETPEEDRGPVVAELFHMEGEFDEICLNIHTEHDKVLTLYYDGSTLVQPEFDYGETSIKKFYKGDTISITF